MPNIRILIFRSFIVCLFDQIEMQNNNNAAIMYYTVTLKYYFYLLILYCNITKFIFSIFEFLGLYNILYFIIYIKIIYTNICGSFYLKYINFNYNF